MRGKYCRDAGNASEYHLALEGAMAATLATRFTGIEFENPFMLASAPPTESDANIMRAFEAGWGGVVVKTIGMHPVINVKGPKTKFVRTSVDSPRVSMEKRGNAVLHSSWNWELISDKPVDWWLPRLRRIKDAFPHKVLVGSEDERELNHWRELAVACQEQGVDAFELNLSCPHMDRVDMGSNIGKNVQLIDTVVRAVKEVARKPVWVKLTPTTTNIAKEAEAAFRAGADAISSSNTFTSLPPIDPASLEFECNVDGLVSYGGLGGPAILPLSLAKVAQMTTAFPDKSFSGIGGVSDFSQALNYFLLGCGTVQVCTAAMLDHAIGPNVIKTLLEGMRNFLDANADRGWRSLDDVRGIRRDRIVAHSQIKRPEAKEYFGGKEAPEGYAGV
jgi:dihydroorotate dehydrogenase